MAVVFPEIRPVDPLEAHQASVGMLECVRKILLHQMIDQFIQIFEILDRSGTDLPVSEAP